MKFLKALTSITLIFSLFTFHIESSAIGWSTAYSQSEPSSLDYSNSEQEVSKLNYASFATMAALSLVPSMVAACPGVWSAYAFAGGGATFLFMEILGYSKYKDRSTSNQEMIATLDDTSNKQIKTLLAAQEQELGAAEALANKASGIKIFAIATTAALVFATLEALADSIPAFGQTVLGAFFAKVCTPIVVNVKPLENESFLQHYARNQEYNDYLFGDGFQSPKATDDFDFSNDYLSAVVPHEQQQTLMQTMYKYSEMISNIILPTAQAKDEVKTHDGGSFWSTVGVSGAALAFATPIAKLFGGLLTASWTRVGLFGALTGLLWTAHAQVDKARKAAEANAKVYGDLASRLGAAINSSARFANMDGVNNQVRNRVTGYSGNRDQVNTVPEGGLCLVGNLGEQRVDSQCQCAKTNTCTKVNLSNVPLQNTGLPGFLGTSLGALGTGSSSLFAGNTQGANAAFGTLGNNAANLRRLSDKLRGDLDTQLKKGKSKFTIAGLEKQALDKLTNDMPRIFNSLPADQKNALAGLTNFGLGGGSIAKGLNEENKKEIKDVLASIKQAGAAPDAGGSADPLAGFKFDFPEDGASDGTDGLGGDGALNQGDALSEYESNESDISDRKNESIFNIITMRYFKSAFPRFFDEDKGPEKTTLE